MALKPCKECGKDISTSAEKCTNCGVELANKLHIGRWLSLAFVIYVLYYIGSCSNRIAEAGKQNTLSATPEQIDEPASCSINKIEVIKLKAHYEKVCNGNDCIKMQGVMTLKNNCNEPTGVQVKVTGYDKNQSPVLVRELWPASVRNINVGEETFSTDFWLDYSPEIKSFTVEPIRVKVWRER